MNATHIHLLTNHIPIIGMVCGAFVLIWAIIAKNRNTTLAAIIILLFSGIGGGIANKSGEEAEEVLEKMVGISGAAIHEHEEAAELAMPFILITAVVSLAALFLNLKNHKFASMSNYLLAVVSVLAFAFSARAGLVGGKIRHAAEINSGGQQNQPAAEESEHD